MAQMYVFGLCEEARVFGKNPRRHWEHMLHNSAQSTNLQLGVTINTAAKKIPGRFRTLQILPVSVFLFFVFFPLKV